MRVIKRPALNALDLYTTCVNMVRDVELRKRLEAIATEITRGETEFISLAETAKLHEFPRQAIFNDVHHKELMDVYTRRLVSENRDARRFYDELISTAPNGKCPLCGVGGVKTLDHHLPKAYYPVLSVTPANLIPACRWCQSEKMQDFPNSADEQTLHPYFDNFESEQWLIAYVTEASPPTIIFTVKQGPQMSAQDFNRLKHHLASFNLHRLFSLNAADELVGIRHHLELLFEVGGPQLVREHLSDQANSRRIGFKNSWQTAMYEAVANSDWFCDGGFRLAV